MFLQFRRVDIAACSKWEGMQCWLLQNLLFVSRVLQIYSPHIFITCEAHFRGQDEKALRNI